MADRTYISEIIWMMEDWNWEKNNAEGIFPDRISTGSDKYAWWKCHVCGNEEFKRCNNWYYGHGCTRCARKRGAKNHTLTTITKNGSFGALYPDLAKEFHSTRNGGLTPFDINKGNTEKVWWLCPQGHEYQTTPSHRVAGNGCPYCSGKKVLAGFNDLALTHPQIAGQWHHEKNGDLTPSKVTSGSKRKVWWLCPQGHSYQSTVVNRVNGNGCPICSGKQILLGFNDLQSQLPEVAQDWHPSKNGTLTPDQVTVGCGKRVWWKCHVCGFEWKQCVYTRQKCGCPACSNKVLYPGHNDLETVNPGIAAQWHPIRNGTIKPCDVISGSNKSYWWQCDSCGHEWNVGVNSRIRGRGCPECAKIKRGKSHSANLAKANGSLQETHPDLVKEWDFARNTDFTPDEVTSGSDKKAWWLCERGHKWKASISSRVNGRGCQKCNDEFHSSFPEQALCFYLGQYTTAESRVHIHGREIDVYLPDLNVGVEYDGNYYHANRSEQDSAKVMHFSKHGIRIIRVVESDTLNAIGDIIHYPVTKDYSNLGNAIVHVFNLLGLPIPNIDIPRDSAKIYGQYIYQRKQNSLAAVCPNVAEEWDYEKNAPITPEMVSYGSKKVFWWKCKNGHEWKTAVCNRANRTGGRSCGFCTGHRKIHPAEIEL